MRTLTSVGWIHVRDERLLAVRTSGRDRFYLPGGKPEADETFEAALIREVREELGLAIDGVGFAFTVSATAHGFDDATVIMHCFHGDPRGEPQAGREITELAWLGVAERDLAAPGRPSWSSTGSRGSARSIDPRRDRSIPDNPGTGGRLPGVKRRRSSAPGRLRPDGRWTHPILLVAVFVLLLAGCDQATSTDTPSGSVPSSEAGSGEPGSPDVPTDAPTDTPTASADPNTPDPGATAPAGSSADPSSGTGSAAACTGSDENRDFFASMAAAVDWTVYCPVVSDGWFVEDGMYRLADGGWMEISYDGPGDARIVLRQGGFCDAGDGCVPSGIDVGDAAFGDRTGTFVAVADGSWAVAVDRGSKPSWLLVVQGLDETGARTIAADLHAVAG